MPELIWKRVIVIKDNKISNPDSFVVTITNNIFQNMSQTLSPFKTVKQICFGSCAEVNLNINKPSLTTPIMKNDFPKMSIKEENRDGIETSEINKDAGESKSKLNEEMDDGIARCCWIDDKKWKLFEEKNYLKFKLHW